MVAVVAAPPGSCSVLAIITDNVCKLSQSSALSFYPGPADSPQGGIHVLTVTSHLTPHTSLPSLSREIFFLKSKTIPRPPSSIFAESVIVMCVRRGEARAQVSPPGSGSWVVPR